MIELIIKIKDTKQTLTMQEAKELYEELRLIFAKPVDLSHPTYRVPNIT